MPGHYECIVAYDKRVKKQRPTKMDSSNGAINKKRKAQAASAAAASNAAVVAAEGKECYQFDFDALRF